MSKHMDDNTKAIRAPAKAAYARCIGRIQRAVAAEAAGLAEGMWNPNFCASGAEDYAILFLAQIEPEIALIRKHFTRVSDEHTKCEDRECGLRGDSPAGAVAAGETPSPTPPSTHPDADRGERR